MYEYYYGTEAEQFNFIKIPRAFFTDKERFGTLSNEAKIMYSLLLDRMNLSMKNGWLDEHNRVYIIYTIDEIAETMGCGTNLAVRILKELDDENGIGLIHKKRRGFGLPTLIYVKKFFVGENAEKRKAEKSSECSKSEFISCENENSDVCKNNTLECSKGECNYTYPNKTDMSYTDNQSFTQACEQSFSDSGNFGMNERIDRAAIEETVKLNIDYDCLMSNDDESVRAMVEEIKEIIVDVLCGEHSVYVGGKKISDEAAKAAFGRLTSEHIMSALHNILNNPNQISQVDRYITAVLYNSSHTFNLSTFSGFTANTGLKMID